MTTQHELALAKMRQDPEYQGSTVPPGRHPWYAEALKRYRALPLERQARVDELQRKHQRFTEDEIIDADLALVIAVREEEAS